MTDVVALLSDLFMLRNFPGLGGLADQLEAGIQELAAENERLRAALETYGQHTERCCIPIMPDGPDCTCGLAEALKGAE